MLTGDTGLITWATNDGNAIVPFRFIGFVPTKIDNKVKSKDVEGTIKVY